MKIPCKIAVATSRFDVWQITGDTPVDYIECRLDLFGSEEILRLFDIRMGCVTNLRNKKPLILTFRDYEECWTKIHQRYNPDLNHKLNVMKALIPLADGVDIEVKHLHDAKALIAKARELGKFVIASAHYFNANPSLETLSYLEEKAGAYGVDVLKVAGKGLNEWTDKHTLSVAIIDTDSGTYNGVLQYFYISTPTAPNQKGLDSLVEQ